MSIQARLDALWLRIQESVPQIVTVVAILLAAWLLGTALRRVVSVLLRRSRLTYTHAQFFRSLTRWLVFLLGVALALNTLGVTVALSGFLAGSGLAAIILGFAFKEIGENLLAGLFLAFSRPFEVADFIQSEALEGEVQAIHLRHTHIRTADGRDIFIPNAQIFNKPLTNYTRDGLRRPSFRIGIDYGDDAGAACRLICAAIETVPGVLDDPKPRAILATFASSYVEIEAHFWINTFLIDAGPHGRRIAQERDLTLIRSDAMEAARRALHDQGFTFSAEVSTAVELAGTPPDAPETPAQR